MRKFSINFMMTGVLSLLLIPCAVGQEVIIKQAGPQEGSTPPPAVQQRAVLVEAVDDGSGSPRIYSFSTSGDGFVMDSTLPMVGSWAGHLPADPSHLINMPQVRKDLELDDDQIRQLQEIQNEFNEKMRGKMNFTHGPDADPNQFKEMRKVLREITEQRKAALGAVLLPHQSKRLQQISTQMKMKNQGDANALVSKDIAEELGIDEDQKKRLKDRAAEIKREMEEEIARIQEEGRKKLLRELTREQRDKLEEMTGDKFELKREQSRRSIQRLRSPRNEDDR